MKNVAGNDNHFKFVQMPLNKSSSDAKEKATQTVMGEKCTAIQAAAELGLYVTIISPLDQARELSGGQVPVEELLDYAVNTDGVLTARVGSKRKEHVEEIPKR